jgi:arabinan endo-1,5-alpha-L-arabinosidase
MGGRRRAHWRLNILGMLALALMLLGGAPSAAQADRGRGTGTYRNPLDIHIPGGGRVESCADPTAIYGQKGERRWYMYCTTDPLNDQDKNASGAFNFHLIPMFSSVDLVDWKYEGDAFTQRPAYAVSDAGLWAPEIAYFAETGQYHLFYTVTNTTLPGGGSAIGVATSSAPLGPWTHATSPTVEPHAPDCCPGDRRWVYDPEVVRANGTDYIYYGSYFGGISVRMLENGLTSSSATQKNVAIANKYEGAEVEFKDGYYYLFVSATDCCRGPLTGYSVFAGRSTNPTGPFVDRAGVDLNDNEGDAANDPTDARAGGSPVLSMNGNRWVGPGHNTVFRDFDGQWWTIYHAIDVNDPYFEGQVGFTKRPALLDPIDWSDGWPTVRGGQWISDTPQHAPAAQPGQKTNYKPRFVRPDRPGQPIAALSDDFNAAALGPQWAWVRQPAASVYGLDNSTLRFNTQAADLFEGSNNASVLTEPTPHGDYMVETRVKLNVPAEGCCFNFVQTGIVIYGDDDNFIKLAHVSIWNTRQTEFAKELFPVPTGYPRYGNTVVGPPNEWTYLRIVKRGHAGREDYSAYTSRDGTLWERGGTWTHQLGDGARIGLVSMGGAGFTANFDYVRVYKLDR